MEKGGWEENYGSAGRNREGRREGEDKKNWNGKAMQVKRGMRTEDKREGAAGGEGERNGRYS